MRGRIRTIKPEVHSDEALWDLEERHGLPLFRLFTGLWNYADREGRFEWRPRALKSLILPYWTGDMEKALDALSSGGFIVQYEVDGRLYGLVRTFKRHQVINNREDQSSLPPPNDACTTRAARVTTEQTTRDDASSESESRVDHAGKDAGQGEGKGRELEGNGKEGSFARAREGSGSDPLAEPGELVGWTAQDQRVAFAAAFESAQGTIANLGGKSVGSFHAEVLRTAELQRVPPRQLFTATLAKWLGAGLDQVARRAPYACFQAAWGDLTAKGPSGPPAGSQAPQTPSQLRDLAREALVRGDSEQAKALMARVQELEEAKEARRAR